MNNTLIKTDSYNSKKSITGFEDDDDDDDDLLVNIILFNNVYKN